MSDYIFRVNDSVRAFCRSEGVSLGVIAEWLGISASAVSLKLSGRREWKVRELNTLSQNGVQLPPFDGDKHMQEQAA